MGIYRRPLMRAGRRLPLYPKGTLLASWWSVERGGSSRRRMGFYTLEQRRPLRPVTPRAVMQTHDIAGATNWAKAPGEHAKGLNTKRSVDPQEPVYALPAARPNRWYEGAPAPTIDPTRRPRSADTNSVADIDGATKRKPVLFQVPRDPFRPLDEPSTGPSLRPRSATREIMRVHDISRPPSANPMRRDLAAARPQTAAPATRPKPVDAQSSGATASAPAPAAQRPQTACGDVRTEHKARAAQQSLLCDWSFASHAALGNELMAAESRPRSAQQSARPHSARPQSTSRPCTASAAPAAPVASGTASAAPSRPRSAQQDRGERREQARDAAERRADILMVHQLPSSCVPTRR